MGKLVLKSNQDVEFTIEPSSGSVPKTVSVSDIGYTRATVEELTSLVATNGEVCVLTDKGRGGTFVYDSAAIANDGTVFGKWVRQYDGAINVKWFGAVSDGVTDDYPAISSAISVALNGRVNGVGTSVIVQANHALYSRIILPYNRNFTLKSESSMDSSTPTFKLMVEQDYMIGVATSDAGQNSYNLTLDGITFDGNGMAGDILRISGNTSYSHTCISPIFKHCVFYGAIRSAVTIGNYVTFGTGTPTLFTGDTITFDSCTFSTERGIYVNVENNYGLMVKNCIFSDTYAGGAARLECIWIYYDHQVTIKDTRFATGSSKLMSEYPIVCGVGGTVMDNLYFEYERLIKVGANRLVHNRALSITNIQTNCTAGTYNPDNLVTSISIGTGYNVFMENIDLSDYIATGVFQPRKILVSGDTLTANNITSVEGLLDTKDVKGSVVINNTDIDKYLSLTANPRLDEWYGDTIKPIGIGVGYSTVSKITNTKTYAGRFNARCTMTSDSKNTTIGVAGVHAGRELSLVSSEYITLFSLVDLGTLNSSEGTSVTASMLSININNITSYNSYIKVEDGVYIYFTPPILVSSLGTATRMQCNIGVYSESISGNGGPIVEGEYFDLMSLIVAPTKIREFNTPAFFPYLSRTYLGSIPYSLDSAQAYNVESYGSGGILYSLSVPTNGTWELGQKVYNSNVSAGGSIGWVCTATGSPGTWKSFGTIEE